MIGTTHFTKIALTPDRVVYDLNGAARQPRFDDCGGVFFIRKDGWSLGVSQKVNIFDREITELVAYRMWEDEWFAWYDPFSSKILPIEDYVKKMQKVES